MVTLASNKEKEQSSVRVSLGKRDQEEWSRACLSSVDRKVLVLIEPGLVISVANVLRGRRREKNKNKFDQFQIHPLPCIINSHLSNTVRNVKIFVTPSHQPRADSDVGENHTWSQRKQFSD